MAKTLVPYLNPGDTASAAKWNVLFAQCDSDIGKAMAGRCLLYFDNSFQTPGLVYAQSGALSEGILGWVSIFSSNLAARRWITGGIPARAGFPYDHSIFENAVASLPVAAVDNTFKFVRLNIPEATYAAAGLTNSDDFFSTSLEKHRKSYTLPGGAPALYWVRAGRQVGFSQPSASYPTRDYDWAQAEIAFENYGSSFTVLAKYNNRRFFRFHNCQTNDVTVTFQKSDGTTAHTVTVPARGSQCVRRSSQDGVYTNGYHYLQKMLPGDYRFMNLGERDPNAVRDAWLHGATNNACNPIVLHKLLKVFRDRGQAASVPDRPGSLHEDPTEVWDAGELYKTQYPPLANGDIIGRWRHHAGKLLHIIQDPAAPDTVQTREVNFHGIHTAVADFAAAGLTFGMVRYSGATTGGGFKISVTANDGKDHWILPVTSNAMGTFEVTTSGLQPDGTYFVPGLNILAVTPNRLFKFTGTTPRFFLLPHLFGANTNAGGQTLQRRQTIIAAGTLTRTLAYSGGSATRTESSATIAGGGFNESMLETTATVAEVRDHLFGVAADFGQRAGKLLKLTGFGPVFTATYEVGEILPPTNPLGANTLVRGLLSNIDNDGNYDVVPPAFISIENKAISWRQRLPMRPGYTWPHWNNPWFISARNTRVYQEYLDGGCTVLVTQGNLRKAGFPPWPADYATGGFRFSHDGETNELQPDGTDLKLHKLTSLPTGLAIQMIVAPPTCTAETTFTKIPVLGLPDPLQSALENLNKPGWWQANKARLEANQLTVDDGVITFKGGTTVRGRLMRFALSVEYYNNLAAMVNANKWAKPLDFRQFQFKRGDGQWVRLLPNQYGIGTTSFVDFAHTIRPRSQYMSILQDDHSSPQICAAAGIPILGLNDCPNLADITTTPRVNMEFTLEDTMVVLGDPAHPEVTQTRSVSVEVESYELTNGTVFTMAEALGAFNLGVPPSYAWLDIEDVQAFAESIGYPLGLADFGVPLALQVFEFPSPDDADSEQVTVTGQMGESHDVGEVLNNSLQHLTIQQGGGPSNGPGSKQWSIPLAVASSEGDWMSNNPAVYKLADHAPLNDTLRSLQFTDSVPPGPPPDFQPYGGYNLTARLKFLFSPADDWPVQSLRTQARVGGLVWLTATRDDWVPFGEYSNHTLLFRNINSAAKALLLPVSWFSFGNYLNPATPTFTWEDYEVIAQPPHDLPYRVVDIADGPNLAGGLRILEHGDAGVSHQGDSVRVVHYVDGMVDL